MLVNLIVSSEHCSRSEVGNGLFPLTPTILKILQRANMVGEFPAKVSRKPGNWETSLRYTGNIQPKIPEKIR